MKINLENAPKTACLGNPVEIGHVYKTQKGILYVVVAKYNGNVTALQVNPMDGWITGAVSYAESYFHQRALLGIVTNLPEDLEIEWM